MSPFPYLSPLVALIGIVGHALMVMTFQKGQLNDSPYIYLRCIAFGSICHLVFSLSDDVIYGAGPHLSVKTFYYLIYYLWSVQMRREWRKFETKGSKLRYRNFRIVVGAMFHFMKAWLVLLTLFMTMER